jgi:hypothetical protein
MSALAGSKSLSRDRSMSTLAGNRIGSCRADNTDFGLINSIHRERSARRMANNVHPELDPGNEHNTVCTHRSGLVSTVGTARWEKGQWEPKGRAGHEEQQVLPRGLRCQRFRRYSHLLRPSCNGRWFCKEHSHQQIPANASYWYLLLAVVVGRHLCDQEREFRRSHPHGRRTSPPPPCSDW